MLFPGQLVPPGTQQAVVVNDFIEIGHLYHVIIIVHKQEAEQHQQHGVVVTELMPFDDLSNLQLRIGMQQIHDPLTLCVIVITLTKDLAYQVKQFGAADATVSFQHEGFILLERINGL